MAAAEGAHQRRLAADEGGTARGGLRASLDSVHELFQSPRLSHVDFHAAGGHEAEAVLRVHCQASLCTQIQCACLVRVRARTRTDGKPDIFPPRIREGSAGAGRVRCEYAIRAGRAGRCRGSGQRRCHSVWNLDEAAVRTHRCLPRARAHCLTRMSSAAPSCPRKAALTVTSR